MKKIICLMLTFLLMLTMTACTITMPEEEKDSANSSSEIESEDNGENKNENSGETESKEEESKEEQNKKEEQFTKMTPAQLDAEIAAQEVKVTSTNYLVQDDQYKSLYPDMLQAIVENGSTYDLKNAVVAFVAWDANNLPVKIAGKYDYNGGSYVKQCNFNDINLVPGNRYGEDSGMALDKDISNIDKFKAIVVSYESFDGDTWKNPLYDAWVELYEGKRYSE